jgi:hypothetical protein
MGKMELQATARAGIVWRFKITAFSTEEDVERYLSNSFGPELYEMTCAKKRTVYNLASYPAQALVGCSASTA